MKDCYNSEGVHIRCKQLERFCDNHPDLIGTFDLCPFCGYRIQSVKNGDPWLYEGATIEIVYNDYDRELARYKGQLIHNNYCVLNTPWSFIHKHVERIKINKNGKVTFQEYGNELSPIIYLRWLNCPESLKGGEYERPAWTKYLPGMKE